MIAPVRRGFLIEIKKMIWDVLLFLSGVISAGLAVVGFRSTN